jgi:hypothetical protein
MSVKRKVMKGLACYLAVAIFLIGLGQKAYAGFSPSEVVNSPSVDRVEDLEKIRTIIELKMVSERLKQLGFTKDEVQAKLDQLDDLQLHQIASSLDELKTGGEGVVIALIAAAVILAILFVVLVAEIIPW